MPVLSAAAGAASATRDRASSPTPSQLPPVPGSPTYSLASTANPISQYNLPPPPPPQPAREVLTKVDLAQSQQAYSDLVVSAKAYRVALASLSTAASNFGSALEACARLKEARAEALAPSATASLTTSFTTKGSCTADLLLSASGLHQLVANHHQILSETTYRSFEVPLLDELDKWQRNVDEEEDSYQRTMKAQSKEIRRLEKEGLKLHKQRRRDVARFRSHLVELTTKLDGLTTLHTDHARTLLRDSQETSAKILDASCSLVRAEVDIFESLARKGWTGGGLDELLEKGVDLFHTDEDPLHPSSGLGATTGEAVKLFSILPPKSILADSSSDITRPGHHRGDSLLSDTDRYQSLAGLASDNLRSGASTAPPAVGVDSDHLVSEFNRSRGVRPFSPQPIRRKPTDVTFESLIVGGSAAGPASETPPEETEEDAPGHKHEAPDDVDDNDDEHPWRNEGKTKYHAIPGSDGDEKDDEDAVEDDRGRSWADIREETR